MTPALRTAFVVEPTGSLAARVAPSMQATGWLALPIMNEIAARWITSGSIQVIVNERRREAHARQSLLHEIFGLPRTAGSLHALQHWLELPRQWQRASQFVEALRHRGVLVTSGDAFAVEVTQPSRAARVSLGAAPTHAALASALETIGSLMRESPEPARPVR